MTVVQVILLLLGGMSLFEAITTSFSVAGTGGFGIKNDSIASYSPYLQWVITIFMLLFGVNFNAYYLLLLRKWKNALKMEEVRYYFLIIAVAIGIIFAIFYRWLEMQQMHCARLLSRSLPLLQQPAIPPLTLTYGRNPHARSWCF